MAGKARGKGRRGEEKEMVEGMAEGRGGRDGGICATAARGIDATGSVAGDLGQTATGKG